MSALWTTARALKSSFLAHSHQGSANSPSVHTSMQGTSAADFVPSQPPLSHIRVSPAESQGLDMPPLDGRNNYSVRQSGRAWSLLGKGNSYFSIPVQWLAKYFILNKTASRSRAESSPLGSRLAPPGTGAHAPLAARAAPCSNSQVLSETSSSSPPPLVTLVPKTSPAISGQAPKYFPDD